VDADRFASAARAAHGCGPARREPFLDRVVLFKRSRLPRAIGRRIGSRFAHAGERC
jgi:hypothetical protein